MGTALQQAIEKVNRLKKCAASTERHLAYNTALNILQSLIPTEKEQIEKAYRDGSEYGMMHDDIAHQINSNDYYTQTYQSK